MKTAWLVAATVGFVLAASPAGAADKPVQIVGSHDRVHTVFTRYLGGTRSFGVTFEGNKAAADALAGQLRVQAARVNSLRTDGGGRFIEMSVAPRRASADRSRYQIKIKGDASVYSGAVAQQIKNAVAAIEGATEAR
jgi:hypothetical protein